MIWKTHSFLLAIYCNLLIFSVLAEKPCNPRQVGTNSSRIICVCDESVCEDLKLNWPTEQAEVFLITSSQAGKRFETTDISSKDAIKVREDKTSIEIDLSKQHQEILGWGGAFTDAAAINILSLPAKLSDKLIESYFGPNGLQYNFGRVPLGGSDFSVRPYSYDDSNTADYNLDKFSLSKEDVSYRIPIIKKAIEYVKQTGTYLKLFSSPWSAPDWMKTSHNLTGGYLIDEDAIYESYANYWIKFFEAFKKNGVEFWGATVQNEPMTAENYGPKYFFNNMPYKNDQLIKFITQYLGPSLKKNGMSKDKFKLMIGDDNLGYINEQAILLMTNKEVIKYVSSFTFHWYSTASGLVNYDNLTMIYNTIKDNNEFIMMTEACEGSMNHGVGVDLGSWERAEMYASDIIEDVNRQTGAWIDWNLALDMKGGPNWANNIVDSPVLVDGTKREFYKQPMYYALAHFSRLFRPGSIRLETTTRDAKSESDILATSVLNKKTGHLIINILNRGKSNRVVDISVKGDKKLNILEPKSVMIEANSINSIVAKV